MCVKINLSMAVEFVHTRMCAHKRHSHSMRSFIQLGAKYAVRVPVTSRSQLKIASLIIVCIIFFAECAYAFWQFAFQFLTLICQKVHNFSAHKANEQIGNDFFFFFLMKMDVFQSKFTSHPCGKKVTD